ncbi:MAG TPA: pyridoxamine 5'-phosphate oxidase family protein [Acidimicrobiales bacterium]|nr:pyridoxamine 5'-phosphate oxidase family protein [Acidimicrobiales bacterium]
MALDLDSLSDDVLTFLSEYHLATLTTQRADGSPHVVAVGFTYDPQSRLARVITWDASQKAVNVARGGTRAVVAQVDGGRWLALEGEARLATDDESAREGERRYAERYSEPQQRDDRAVIEIMVDRILGRG